MHVPSGLDWWASNIKVDKNGEIHIHVTKCVDIYRYQKFTIIIVTVAVFRVNIYGTPAIFQKLYQVSLQGFYFHLICTVTLRSKN